MRVGGIARVVRTDNRRRRRAGRAAMDSLLAYEGTLLLLPSGTGQSNLLATAGGTGASGSTTSSSSCSVSRSGSFRRLASTQALAQASRASVHLRRNQLHVVSEGRKRKRTEVRGPVLDVREFQCRAPGVGDASASATFGAMTFGFEADVLIGSARQTLTLCCRDEYEQRSWLRAVSVCTKSELHDRVTEIGMRRLKATPWVKIGEGTFGAVFRATYDGTPVAIKRLKFEINAGEAADQDYAIQLVSEVAAMSGSNHINLVRFYGIAVEDGMYHLITELCENGDLSQLIHKWDESGTRVLGPCEPLSFDLQRRIASEIFNGLAFLHGSNVLHRDLKPQNVLLDRNYTAKIADLGQATVLAQQGMQLTAGPGTPLYMAPEVMQAGPRMAVAYNTSSDVYAAGLIMYEMFTQKVPFIGDNAMLTTGDLPTAIRRGLRPVLADESPPGLCSVIQRCWAHDSSRRPLATVASDLMQHPLLYHRLDFRCDDLRSTLQAVASNFWPWHELLLSRIDTALVHLASDAAAIASGRRPSMAMGVPVTRSDGCKLFNEGDLASLLHLVREHLEDSEHDRIPLRMLEVVVLRSTADEPHPEDGSWGVQDTGSATAGAGAGNASGKRTASSGNSCEPLARQPSFTAERMLGLFLAGNGAQRLSDVLLVHKSQPDMVLSVARILGRLVFVGFSPAIEALAESGVGCAFALAWQLHAADEALALAAVYFFVGLSAHGGCLSDLLNAGVVEAMVTAMCHHMENTTIQTQGQVVLRNLATIQSGYEQVVGVCANKPGFQDFLTSLALPDTGEETPNEPERLYNIVLLGPSGVGKTALWRRFFNESFDVSVPSTLGLASNVKRVMVDGKAVLLNINDTAGQERFGSLAPIYLRDCHGAVLVYRIDNASSLTQLESHVARLKEISPDACVVLAGNACDRDAAREVNPEDAQRLADQLGCPHILTSAMLNVATNDLLLDLIKRMIKAHRGVDRRPLLEQRQQHSSQSGCWRQ
eukprot:m.21939 g.21939  ORF g.21939 m.21939 type:complete len:993 (-) comp6609_c0_seq1:64-3042(-)